MLHTRPIVPKVNNHLFALSVGVVWICTLLFTPHSIHAAELRISDYQWKKGRYVVIDTDMLEPHKIQTLRDLLDSSVKHFSDLFPGLSRPNRPVVVRYHASQEGYIAYGKQFGRGFTPLSNGYYRQASKPEERELVFFHQENDKHLKTSLHECWHHVIHDSISQIGYMPRWFNEGIAEYIERSTIDEQGDLTIPNSLNRPWIKELTLIASGEQRVPLQQLFRMEYKEWAGNLRMNVATSYSFIHFLHEAHPKGQRALRSLIRLLAQGSDYTKSFKKSFGRLSLAQIETDYYQWLRTKIMEEEPTH